MSYEYCYYRPSTPPRVPLGELLGTGHSRHASDSSIYSNDSSPWSAVTATTSPGGESPPRHHHGPALLPKIRSQDVVIEPVSARGPQRQRLVLSNTRNPPGFLQYPPSRPSNQHDGIETGGCFPEGVPLVSPVSVPSPLYGPRKGSALSSPVSITPSHKRRATSSGHSRSRSSPSVDEETLKRYGYPTYRQLPHYTDQAQSSPTTPATPVTPNIVVYPPYQQPCGGELQPPRVRPRRQVPLVLPGSPYSYNHIPSAQCSPMGITQPVEAISPHSTTLLSYLTGPTQAINLVRNVSVVPTRGMHDYFWWDIRNLRSWTSFSLSTFNEISGLMKLLTTTIPAHLTPHVPVPSTRLSPDSEPSLINLIQDIYAPRVNAALAVSQGPDHLRLYAAPIPRTTANRNYGGPHFLANYASDTEQTLAGLPRGRLVGIAKSFDRWNTGMRNEGPHRRVEYLKGLAHLQRCMREHSCRYGFIITEIELVCVRAGCDAGDDVPYFGFLEISAPIPTNTAATPHQVGGPSNRGGRGGSTPPSYNGCSPTPSSSDDSSLASQSPLLDNYQDHTAALPVPMTASFALYFLLMLSKSVPLPSQPSSHLNVGGPGALTRQRFLPDGKDKWIPEPQIGERRDAKRVRGWVWPQDAWHRREGGGVPRSRAGANANAAGTPRVKKWHK